MMFGAAKDIGNTRRFDPMGLNGDWQAYAVPQFATALLIVAVGSGGRGGDGFSRAAGNPGGGGGGGGSGAIARLFVPTFVLPPMLYVSPGSGDNTLATYVSLSPDPQVAAETLLEARSGGNGGNGTAAAVGAAGAAGAATQSGAYQSLGALAASVGMAGGAGGSVTGGSGTGITIGSSTVFVTGGAGGAGCTSADQNGASINTGMLMGSTIGAGVAGAGNHGRAGFELWMPPCFTGGSGGAALNAAAGGNGGPGARGSGGGGGGAGTTGGTGGRGGDGFVFITAIF